MKGVIASASIFLFAFILNLVWENSHVFLYTGYDRTISVFNLLLRASLWDASFITSVYLLLAAIFEDSHWFNKKGKGKVFLIFTLTFTAAILVEKSALSSGRWLYREIMPLLPYFKTGLTPTLQLFATSLLSFGLADLLLPKLFKRQFAKSL